MALELKRKKKESELLDEQSVVNQWLKDEIDKEVKLSSMVQTDCQRRINELQKSATSLCRFIEVEKKKNSDLKTIIEHMSRGSKSDGENCEDLTKRLQKLQYDFDQLVQKQNEAHAHITEIKQNVNASRTERVIYSGVFRNIEREIRESEEQFKMLLIQRFHAEKRKAEADLTYDKYREETSKRIATANRNLIKSTKQLEARSPSVRDLPDQSTLQLKQAIEEASSHNRKFVELQRATGVDSMVRRCATNHHNSKQPQEDPNSAMTQLLLKKIESDTGVVANELSRYLKSISLINEALFEESDSLANAIDEQEQLLAKLEARRHRKVASEHRTQSATLEMIKHLEGQYKAMAHKAYEEEQELMLLHSSENFSTLLGMFGLTKNGQAAANELPSLYRQIGDRIQPILLSSTLAATGTSREEAKDDTLSELIEHSDKSKECQKIMLKREMEEYCQKQLSLAKEAARKQQQRTLQNRKRKLV